MLKGRPTSVAAAPVLSCFLLQAPEARAVARIVVHRIVRIEVLFIWCRMFCNVGAVTSTQLIHEIRRCVAGRTSEIVYNERVRTPIREKRAALGYRAMTLVTTV